MSVKDYIIERVDSWLNVAMGFGGATDKIKQTRYSGCVRVLPEGELTAMYRTEHLSAKIVDVYPKESYREGIELAGYAADEAEADGEDDTEEQISNVLRQWKVIHNAYRAAVWARLYGGAAIWLGSFTADPAAPFAMGEKIDFLRVIDRRYLQPRGWTLDAQGCPLFYDIVPEEGAAMVGPVHKSRLVMFPGAMTDARTRINNGYWDDSVLQRPYEALQADGLVWRSAQQLLSEASIGVLKIKGLYQKLTGPAREKIESRLAFFNATRSVARNMTLDFDGEDYKRETTQFAGVSDLTREAITRVASAAEIPVAILLSDEPSGLNATGDSSIRWWLMRVHAYRISDLEEPTLYLCKALLAQAGIGELDVEKLAIKWPALWTPSAGEQAEIRAKTSQADRSDIEMGILSSDDVARSRYGKDGYSQETTIDRSEHVEPTEDELRAAAEAGAGEDDEAAPAAKPGEGPAGENVQAQVLNGAQVSSLKDIVTDVAAEVIPRDAGVQIIMLAYQVDQAKAEALLGSAGNGFKPKEEPVPAPFGGGVAKTPGVAPPGQQAKPGDEKAPPPPAKKGEEE